MRYVYAVQQWDKADQKWVGGKAYEYTDERDANNARDYFAAKFSDQTFRVARVPAVEEKPTDVA